MAENITVEVQVANLNVATESVVQPEPGKMSQVLISGADGLSAYQVAVADGFVGDVSAWLASLVGPPGPTTGLNYLGEVANYAALDQSYTGDESDVFVLSDTGHAWKWDGAAWVDIGRWRGIDAPAELTGLGTDGLSDLSFLRVATGGGLEARTPAQLRSDIGAEPALGNPGTSGWFLSSDDEGNRSWAEVSLADQGLNKADTPTFAGLHVSAGGFIGGTDSDSGWSPVGTGVTMDFVRDNVIRARFSHYCEFSNRIGIGTGAGSAVSPNVFLWNEDSTDVLALRNGTNPNEFRVYNTSSGAADYERGFMRWNANVFEIGTEADGSGQYYRAVHIDGHSLQLGSHGSNKMVIYSSRIATYTDLETYQLYPAASWADLGRTDRRWGTTFTENLDASDKAIIGSTATPGEVLINNTYTDASNYERFYQRWDTDELHIGNEAAGTGVARRLIFDHSIGIPRTHSFYAYHLGAEYPLVGLDSASRRIFGDLVSNTGTRVRLSGTSIDLEGNAKTLNFNLGALGANVGSISSDGDLSLGGVYSNTLRAYESITLWDVGETTAKKSITVPLNWAIKAPTQEVLYGSSAAIYCGRSFYPSLNDSRKLGYDARVWSEGWVNDMFMRQFTAPDGSGAVSQMDGLNPQEFRIYNTYTDASNYERGYIRWDANTLKIGTEQLGGTHRAVNIEGADRVRLIAAGFASMQIFSGSVMLSRNMTAYADIYSGADGAQKSGRSTNKWAGVYTYKTNQRTETAAAPTLTEYPDDGDQGDHWDSTAGKLYHCHNKGGTLYAVEMTALP